MQEVDNQCDLSGLSACLKANLTYMGRISLPQPSLQKVGPLCLLHNSASESQSFGIFVYGRRQCHVSESFLSDRDKKGSK